MANTKKTSAKRKLLPAVGMLAISATMLATSTYAWFTMNKEVSVTGMQVKAHAEEGLLINEVKTAGDTNWDEQATANVTPTTVVMRPASTANLTTWWHANSKRSNIEAGVDNLSGTVSVGSSGTDKYTDISDIQDNALVPAGEATGNTKAETHVYYKDASFGRTSGTCEDGEGFYVKYTYYLKSSGDRDLPINDLQVQVKATKNTTEANASGSSDNLDPALRVGVVMPISTAEGAASSKALIFSPIPGTAGASGAAATNTTYGVTTSTAGTSSTNVTSVVAGSKGTFTAYTTLNNSETAITIPKVTSNGIPVYVYVWYEGEDTHCMSDNLTAALAAYDIDINFRDNDQLY